MKPTTTNKVTIVDKYYMAAFAARLAFLFRERKLYVDEDLLFGKDIHAHYVDMPIPASLYTWFEDVIKYEKDNLLFDDEIGSLLYNANKKAYAEFYGLPFLRHRMVGTFHKEAHMGLVQTYKFCLKLSRNLKGSSYHNLSMALYELAGNIAEVLIEKGEY